MLNAPGTHLSQTFAHKTFYAHRLTVPQGEHLLCVSALRGMLQRFNPPKVAILDNVLGAVLRDDAHELINWVQTDNISFSEAVVLVCLKISVIIPKPKMATVKSINDYCTVAPTPKAMKSLSGSS